MALSVVFTVCACWRPYDQNQHELIIVLLKASAYAH